MDKPPSPIRFLPEGIETPYSAGDTILAHSARAGVPILSPCGGQGRCGKCRVAVSGPVRGGDDPGFLGRDEIRAGIRLACRCIPLSGGVSVTVLPESGAGSISAMVEGSDLAMDEPFVPIPAATAGEIPLGAALDLGTSTLAGALVDLSDGRIIARASGENPQVACGEDLISRIMFAEDTDGGLDLLRGMLAAGIGKIVADLLRHAPGGREIAEVTAAGNTVISHILYGLSPSPIRFPPHAPVRKEYPPRTGAELGLSAGSGARWRIFPSIGGFVGGDIAAGMLASGMHRTEAVSLFFDVGTNGEVVLGNRDWRIACSSSAGPAFEGGEVACGMRAFPGAIESVAIHAGRSKAEFTVIGGGKPRGICGSGILDLCAALFRAGLLDRAGRFVRRPGAPFVDTARGEAYVVAEGGETANGRPILFAAPDVKSVLRTKAALCAAAESLLAAVGIAREEVDKVYIAGGFGNFIDLRSALTLGVFPPFPPRKFVPLGNASLAGAVGALRSRKRWKEAVACAAATSYHDLSSDDRFMESYQRALFIPHTEEERYRMVMSPEPPRR